VKIEVRDVRTKAQRTNAVPDEDTKMSGDGSSRNMLISTRLGKGFTGGRRSERMANSVVISGPLS
jgi:hypothetical protein